MKNKLNRIFKIISSMIFLFLVALIILILVYIFRINYLASKDRLGEVRTNFYTILTQSMYPKIKAGDIVITYKEDDDKYNKDDVITFLSEANGNIIITHRVAEVYNVNDNFSYKTKGDNNNAADTEIIPSYNVLGKVVFKIPKAGYIQQFLVSRTGWIIAIVLPSLGIIIYDVLKILKSFGKIGKKQKKIETEEEKEARERLRRMMRNSLDDAVVIENLEDSHKEFYVNDNSDGEDVEVL